MDNDERPIDYYNSSFEWAAALNEKNGESGKLIPFNFGGGVQFGPPKSIEEDIHPYLTPYCSPSYNGYIASIPGGKVWGEHGAVLSADGKLIFDLSQEFNSKQYRMLEAHEHPVFHHWNNPPLQKIKGTAALLTFCGSHNYFHWMYDVLPRIVMLEATGIPYSQIIMNPNPYGSFVEQTWTMLGISKDIILCTHPEFYLQPEKLLVPSLMMNSHYPRWGTATLRQLLLPHREAALTSPERIFLTRTQGYSRRIVNEDQVINCLEAEGFVAVSLENWTVAEQIQIFANAKVIAGPHGAGFTNLAFCQPGTRVIEIFHNAHIVPTYWMISNHMSLDYYMLYGQGLADSKVLPGVADFYVDIERLKQTLRLAGL